MNIYINKGYLGKQVELNKSKLKSKGKPNVRTACFSQATIS